MTEGPRKATCVGGPMDGESITRPGPSFWVRRWPQTLYTGPHDPPGKPLEGSYVAMENTNEDGTINPIWQWEEQK